MTMVSMSSFVHIQNMVLVVLVLLLSASLYCEALPVKTVVRVINDLGPGIPLDINCWSSEDQLGAHTLQYQQFFEWRFTPNIWGSTKFECNLGSPKGSGNYYMYKQSRDVLLCEAQCYWYVKAEGPCLQSFKPDKQFCSAWGRPPKSSKDLGADPERNGLGDNQLSLKN